MVLDFECPAYQTLEGMRLGMSFEDIAAVFAKAFMITGISFAAVSSQSSMEIVKNGDELLFRSKNPRYTFSEDVSFLLRERKTIGFCSCGNKHRLHFDFTKGTRKQFDDIKKQLKVSGDAETLRQTLMLFDRVSHFTAQGYECDIKRHQTKDGAICATLRTPQGDKQIAVLPT